MGLFDFLKRTVSTSQTTSKYEHLPLVDVEADKRTPKGYVERKFLDEEKLYISCDNVFYQSNIPIVNQCEKATKLVDTLVLLDPSGKRMRSVSETIYFPVPEALKQEYLQLVAQLNNLIIKYELPKKYIFALDKIVFTAPINGSYDIPLTHIEYNQDKNEFYFIFKNEVIDKGPSKYSTPLSMSTDYGSIVFNEDGTIKKAEITRNIKGQDAKIRFKQYKTGLDLYDVRYDGSIVYKRNAK